MAQQQVTQIGHDAALLLPPDVLEQTSIHIGDMIDISIVDGMLIVSPLHEAEREKKIQDAIQKVFAHRKSAYQQLA